MLTAEGVTGVQCITAPSLVGAAIYTCAASWRAPIGVSKQSELTLQVAGATPTRPSRFLGTAMRPAVSSSLPGQCSFRAHFALAVIRPM